MSPAKVHPSPSKSLRQAEANFGDSLGAAWSQLSLRVAEGAEGGSPGSPGACLRGPPSPPRAPGPRPRLQAPLSSAQNAAWGPWRLNLSLSQSPGLINPYNLCRKYDLYLISPHLHC